MDLKLKPYLNSAYSRWSYCLKPFLVPCLQVKPITWNDPGKDESCAHLYEYFMVTLMTFIYLPWYGAFELPGNTVTTGLG